MQVTIEADISLFLLSPVVQLLKIEIDVKQVTMGLYNLGRTKLSHQSFWVAGIEVHVPFNNTDAFPKWRIWTQFRIAVMKNGVNFAHIAITDFFHNQAIAMGIAHYNDGLLCHDGNTSKSFLTAKAR